MRQWKKSGLLLMLICVLPFIVSACGTFASGGSIRPKSIELVWRGAAKELKENEYELEVGKTAWVDTPIPTPADPGLYKEYRINRFDIELSDTGILHHSYGALGTVTGIKPGKVTVTVTYYYVVGKNEEAMPVDVVFHVVEKKGDSTPTSVPDFQLESEPEEPDIGTEIQMIADGLTPEQSARGKWSVTYNRHGRDGTTEENPNAGSPISADGKFMVYEPCRATVTFQCGSRMKTKAFMFDEVSDFSMALSPKSVRMNSGDFLTIQPLFKPLDKGLTNWTYKGTKQGEWSSSNTGVAAVNENGVVTGIAPGKAVITFRLAKCNQTGYFREASSTVTVQSPPSKENPGGGQVIPGGGQVTPGGGQVTPGGGQQETVTHTVTFYAQGETPWATFRVKNGTGMAAPSAPQRDGFEFIGWFDRQDGGRKWNFNSSVWGNVTLYAHWRELPNYPVINGSGELFGIANQAVSAEYSVKSNFKASLKLDFTSQSLQGVSVLLKENSDGSYMLSLPDGAPLGRHSVVLKADNSGLNSIMHVSIQINEPVSLSPLELPRGRQNEPYSQQLTPAGGRAPYTLAAVEELPEGLELKGDIISGTPAVSGGTYPFAIRVTDADGNSFERKYNLRVFQDVSILGDSQITLLEGSGGEAEYTLENPGGAALRIGSVNTASAALVNTGSDTYKLIIPNNLSAGRYSVRLETDMWEVSRVIAVVVHANQFVPVEEITGIPTYMLGGRTLQLNGSVKPQNASVKKIEWSFVDPVQAQTYATITPEGELVSMGGGGTSIELLATVKDGIYGGNYTQKFTMYIEYDIDVDPREGALPFTAVDAPYKVQFNFTNGAGGPYLFSMAPGSTLPPGLKLEHLGEAGGNSAASLSGKPTQKGEYAFTIRAEDKDKNYKDFNYTLKVNGSPAFKELTLPEALRQEPYTTTLTAIEGMGGPYEIRLAPGQSLPPGLSLRRTSDNTAVVEGTPTECNDYPIKMRVTDIKGNFKDYDFIIGVHQYFNTKPVTDITNLRKTLIAGQSCQLSGTVMPQNAEKSAITWNFDGPSPTSDFVTLSKDGVLTSNGGTGTVRLCAIVQNGAVQGDFVKKFTVEIVEPITLAGDLPEVTVDEVYENSNDSEYTLEVSGGAGGVYRLVGWDSGTLPKGMSMEIRTSGNRYFVTPIGAPKEGGTYNISFTVADKDGNYQTFISRLVVYEKPSVNSVLSLALPAPTPEPLPETASSPGPEAPSTENVIGNEENTGNGENAGSGENTGNEENAGGNTGTPTPSPSPTPAPTPTPTPAPSPSPTPAPSPSPSENDTGNGASSQTQPKEDEGGSE